MKSVITLLGLLFLTTCEPEHIVFEGSVPAVATKDWNKISTGIVSSVLFPALIEMKDFPKRSHIC